MKQQSNTSKKRAEKQLAVPTPDQSAWQDMEIEMFVHISPATWQGIEHDDLSCPLSAINPRQLDTEQWVEVAQSLGAGQIIFTAKHVGGFCWWQTATSGYGVKETPWRGGKGDVVRDLAESCRRHGIKLGIYLSPQDKFLGAGLGGRTQSPEKQAQYTEIFRAQLTELLSRYGEISEVWFDGSAEIDVGDILRQYAPVAMVLQSKYTTLRWVGNEAGVAPYPAWNSVRRADAEAGVATAFHGTPAGKVWLPLECDTTIRSHYWFWKDDAGQSQKLKSLKHLMQIYYGSVGHGAVLLLNSNPDTTGVIPELDAKRAAEFGAEIRRRFGKSLAEKQGTGEREIVLELGQKTPLDHVIVMEDISGGERVRAYVVEGWDGGEWRRLAGGTAVGHKKIDRFPVASVDRVRLRVLESADTPLIRRFAVFYTDVPYEGGDGRSDPGTMVLAELVADAGQVQAAKSSKGELTMDFDLKSVCEVAGQYVVTLENQSKELSIVSATLMHNGEEYSQYVTPLDRPNAYNVNLTAVDGSLVLRLELRIDCYSGGILGRILIQKA